MTFRVASLTASVAPSVPLLGAAASRDPERAVCMPMRESQPVGPFPFPRSKGSLARKTTALWMFSFAARLAVASGVLDNRRVRRLWVRRVSRVPLLLPPWLSSSNFFPAPQAGHRLPPTGTSHEWRQAEIAPAFVVASGMLAGAAGILDTKLLAAGVVSTSSGFSSALAPTTPPEPSLLEFARNYRSANP